MCVPLKKWQAAEIAYRQAIIFNKKSIEARKGLCQIALHSQDWPAVDRLIDEIFEISPGDKETEILYKTYSKPYQITIQGDSLRILRKWNDAEKSYKKALKRDANFKPALMGLGKIAYTRHNWKQVKRWFLQVLELQPGQEEAIYYLTTPPDAAVLHTVKRADSLFAAGNLKQAKREYKRALKKYAGVISAFRGLGRIAVREKYWVKVFLRFDQVLEIFPDDLEARYNEAVAYLEMAKFSPPLNSDKLLDIAEEKWNQLMQIDSTYSDVLYQRALVEKLRDNLTGAISWTKRQLRLKPDLAKANIGLLKIYREFLYRYQNVDISLWPRLSNDGWTYYIIGEYHRRRFRLQQAERIFADLLVAHRLPSDVPIYLALTKLYIQKNDRNKAYEAYQHVQSGISSDLDAEFLFEATKYIFTDKELKDFHALHGGENKQAFFYTFWGKRNPLPVAQVDVRVIEHFLRLTIISRCLQR